MKRSEEPSSEPSSFEGLNAKVTVLSLIDLLVASLMKFNLTFDPRHFATRASHHNAITSWFVDSSRTPIKSSSRRSSQ